MDTKNTPLTVFSVTAITVFGRILSLISFQLYMGFYGPKDANLNIYSYALVMPNTVFTCIGTLLTTVVVPIYSGLLAKKSTAQAKKFLDDIISISSLLIGGLIIAGVLLAPVLVHFSGFKDTKEQFDYAVFSIRMLMPVMLTYGLTFIFQGILQSNGMFKLPAAVSIPSSLIVIIYVLLLGGKFGVTGLLLATFIGLLMQAVILLPAVIKTGYRFKPSFDFKSPHIITCLKLAAPVLVGVSAYQINTIFNTTIAARFNSVTLMQNVYNLVVVSILTFVYSLVAVYYPRFTVEWADDDKTAYKKSLKDVMSILIYLLIPATFGFIVIRYNLFNLLSNWGKVTTDDVLICGDLLALYSLGIWALGFKEVMDRAFYAQKNAKISGAVGVVIMGLNVVFNLSLVGALGLYAMPLSFSLSSSIGVALLIILMGRKIGSIGGGVIMLTLKCVAAGALMYVLTGLEVSFMENLLDNSIISRIIKLFVPAGTGVIIYFICTYFMNVTISRSFGAKLKQFLAKRQKTTT